MTTRAASFSAPEQEVEPEVEQEQEVLMEAEQAGSPERQSSAPLLRDGEERREEPLLKAGVVEIAVDVFWSVRASVADRISELLFLRAPQDRPLPQSLCLEFPGTRSAERRSLVLMVSLVLVSDHHCLTGGSAGSRGDGAACCTVTITTRNLQSPWKLLLSPVPLFTLKASELQMKSVVKRNVEQLDVPASSETSASGQRRQSKDRGTGTQRQLDSLSRESQSGRPSWTRTPCVEACLTAERSQPRARTTAGTLCPPGHPGQRSVWRELARRPGRRQTTVFREDELQTDFREDRLQTLGSFIQ
ncbi:uncharacterized protein LOC115407042 isoform X1 [Salarias fasciatus]|uniref:uncharacterized protein LOC115407042 isoform X1 n=1 Tax=Salarias fasciatus TaxID=181472 RepID=UPI0011764FBA|nr:uncharacterized protein LOC115407042 isoform X1 [Salarias fasciatus]